MNIVQKGGKEVPKIIDNPEEVILSHARDIILNDGYTSLTMRKVSNNSGIAVGTIYNYFPTKDHLTLRLMEDYWYDYLKALDEIDRLEADLFAKLFRIYKKLDDFTQTFLEVWVKNSTPGYTEDSRNRKKNFMQKLSKRLEEILMEAHGKEIIHLPLEPSATAEFLLLNFLTMAQMKQFEYNNFEKILKKLFE